MSKRLTEIAAEIVQGQVSRSPMSSDEIVSSLKGVFGVLMTMNTAETEDVSLDVIGSAPKTIKPKDSIRDDKVVCLECGSELKQLTAKHLQTHGLSPRDYKKKWGFPMAQPLSAKSLTKARSKAARKRGLPVKLREYLDARKKLNSESALQPVAAPVELEIGAEKKAVKRRAKKPATA
jgi:predicted transcriptional regulator